MTREEFQHIINSITDKLFRFAVQMMSNIHEAEDVVQDVLLKLWQQQDKLSKVDNIEAWSIRVTRNLSIDKIRSRKRFGNDETLLSLASSDDTPEMQLQRNDWIQQVERLMQQLPEKQKMVMHLRDVEAYSYDEIAQMLDIPLHQVKVNLFRARTTLRVQLIQLQERV